MQASIFEQQKLLQTQWLKASKLSDDTCLCWVVQLKDHEHGDCILLKNSSLYLASLFLLLLPVGFFPQLP